MENELNSVRVIPAIPFPLLWGTPLELCSLSLCHPPDKSGGYAQATPTELEQNSLTKYRIRSARLRNWNYGSDAIYFVTICTQGRECFFGEITNIDINMTHDCRDVMHRVSANKPVTTNNIVTNTEYKNTFAPQSKNLASIIRGFKSSVTINARKINANFGWQSRFHDHIIRNEESFQRI